MVKNSWVALVGFILFYLFIFLKKNCTTGLSAIILSAFIGSNHSMHLFNYLTGTHESAISKHHCNSASSKASVNIFLHF